MSLKSVAPDLPPLVNWTLCNYSVTTYLYDSILQTPVPASTQDSCGIITIKVIFKRLFWQIADLIITLSLLLQSKHITQIAYLLLQFSQP